MAKHADELLIPWHRLFGMYWVDFATDLPLVVEVEKDLSVQKQLLDILILRKTQGQLSVQLPDGFDNLAQHNLITFKSFQEPLDGWSLKELISHSVTYRKLASPARNQLLPEDVFRLYAVCSRFPHNLTQTLHADAWQALQEGVYTCQWGTDLIRVIVLRELPRHAHNAMLHLFSGARDLVEFGREHFQQRSPNTSRLLKELLTNYDQEGGIMSYTMEDFRRDSMKRFLMELTPEERVEVLDEVPTEAIEKYLEQRKKNPPPKKRAKKK